MGRRREANHRPASLGVLPNGIPDELKGVPRWVCWSYRRVSGRWKKVPFRVRDGRNAKVSVPEDWSDFGSAIAAYRRGRFDGVGLVFSGDGLCGLDLDRCRDAATGHLDDWASRIVSDFATYTEVSPSGTGVKLFVRGDMANGSGRRRSGVEVYSGGRYFAVTGHVLPNTTTGVGVRTERLRSLVLSLSATRDATAGSLPEFWEHSLTDEEVLAKASAAKNGRKFRRLLTGQVDEYDSPSEADMALCVMLAYWAGPRPEQIERLFAQSELAGRAKWQEREDYRKETVTAAVSAVMWQEAARKNGLSGIRTKQIRQDKQDQAGFVNTVEGVVNAALNELSPGDRTIAVGVAESLVPSQKGRAPWRSMFALARRLRRELAGKYQGDAYHDAVAAYCQAAGEPIECHWYAFLKCWPQVLLAEGEDPVEWAVNMARAQPRFLPTKTRGPLYASVASVAYYLSELRGDDPFWFDYADICRMLDLPTSTYYDILSLLERDGVIVCTSEKYDSRKRLAKEYRYAGKRLDATPSLSV